MMIKGKDIIFKYGCILHSPPELIMLSETIRYFSIISINEYSQQQHKQKDTNIELWLADKLRIFEDEETMERILTKEEKKRLERDSYVS